VAMKSAWLAAAAGMTILAAMLACGRLGAGEAKKEPHAPPPPPSEEFAKKLKDIPYRIVYETFRDDNWELFSVKANGSDPVNLTNTPKANELYPHVSPDGAKVSFVADEFEEGAKQPKARSAWYMNLDGTGRTKVADGIREACWNSHAAALALLPCEFDRFTYEDYATKGVKFYDLATGKITDHPNKDLYHLYNLCWSPDGKWFVATVHGGMGYKHAILAFEAEGTKVFDLKIPGCRPDLSPDGKKITWGVSDWELAVADFDTSSGTPTIAGRRAVVKSAEPIKIYHSDWSPDGRYVTFSRGPQMKTLKFAPEMIGIPAAGWNLCVADANGSSVWTEITSDGNCDKEPDWAPVKTGGAP
jgi:Tol biopolymer transport system component